MPTDSPAAYIPNELLGRLVGFRLYSVQFVLDYVQLWFDSNSGDRPILTCDVLPRMEREGDTFIDGHVGYADALRGLISGVVSGTVEATGTGLRLEFGHDALALHPHREELVGPEIATLNGFEDGQWMCWRPGEDSFEDLA